MTREEETELDALPRGVEFAREMSGHSGWIGRIAWSPNGQILATPSWDHTIRLWDVYTGKCLRELKGHKGGVVCTAFDQNNLLLASGSYDNNVKLWDTESGRLLRTLKGHIGGVNSVCFDPQGHNLASGSDDGTVIIWEATSGKLLRRLEGHRGAVFSIVYDPHGRTLITSSEDETVRIWALSTGRQLRRLKGHGDSITSISIDSHGKVLATGSDDTTINLWDVGSGKLLRTLEGHTSIVHSVAFSADCRVLASKGLDSSIRLWCVETGSYLASIEQTSSSETLPSLIFHPQLPILASVSSERRGYYERDTDRLIHVWNLDFDLLLSQAKKAVIYTSVKVVLVGESNVGKSYLAHRIATDRCPRKGSINSTHGMKFWPMAPEDLSPNSVAPEGQLRDVVLWDMGGQDEYRLVHQLFLRDTTLALVLFDPTRGRTAFEEIEAWNKRLEKQLDGRSAIKLLVGAKQDKPSDTIDRNEVNRLCCECGFSNYYETSSISGRGVPELRTAMANAIDWEALGQTSRPELFQRIRDEIEELRKEGEVILHVSDLQRKLRGKTSKKEEAKAIDAVTEQLAKQGLIARSHVSTGERVLVLQVQEIERYAGSLIIAARNNIRGVPALELRAISRPDFILPGISTDSRLPRNQERPVLECTVELLLEHGICFQHEGLLIFPSLFNSSSLAKDIELSHSVSLYYDFSGAIDNIYASLVAWLVLAQNFGRVRLWADRAEFEVKDGGLCGLRKVTRPGGFAHIDVYFEINTPMEKQKLFICFVEEHLNQNGVEIQEHLAIKCQCGHQFPEETLRQRIARGDKDVGCPLCDKRHNLAEGASISRVKNPMLNQKTWAIKTEVEKRRHRSTEQAVRVMETSAQTKVSDVPIRLLHLSDLHFDAKTPVAARLQWLLDDLKQESGLGIKELDYLVITGDFTNKACTEGFEKAYEFVSGLTQEFCLSAERCVFVPGNHDMTDLVDAYVRKKSSIGLSEGEWFNEGRIILARDPLKYQLRFKPFSDGLFHKFLQLPYPAEYAEQGMAIPFWDSGIQFLALNSCWQIDEFHRKRSGVNVEAVARVLNMAQKQENEARESGVFMPDRPLLRIALWHHAVAGPEQMKDVDFLGNLQKNGVKMALHGDIHEMRSDLVGYFHEKKIHVVGSGSFGARAVDRPEASPCLYNVIEISRDLGSARVHTRRQTKADGPWDGWHEWSDPDGGNGRVPFYDIKM